MNLSANRLFYWACLVFSLLLRACPVLAQPGGVGQALLGYDIAEIGLDGRTWIVSPAGDDDGEGTEADPLRTLQAAADRVEPGDTVLVRAGTYTNTDDHALVIFRRGGTAERWVRLANYPGETPTLQFDSLRGIKTEGASYLVIEGFRIIGAAADVDPQAAFDHAERFVGEDYSQTRFFGVGIRIDGRDSEPRVYSHHIIVRDNVISDCSGGGIATARADYLLIENNEVFRCSFYTPWGGSGISVWQSADFDDRTDLYRTVIQNNRVYLNDNRVKFWMMKAFSDGNGIILDALHNSQEGIVGDGYTQPYTGRVLVPTISAFSTAVAASTFMNRTTSTSCTTPSGGTPSGRTSKTRSSWAVRITRGSSITSSWSRRASAASAATSPGRSRWTTT